MTPLELLEERVSISSLQAPGPSPEVIARAMRAAVRAPDHAQLRPWRFLVIEGEGLVRLGDLFVQATLAKEPDFKPEKQEKLRGKPQRAPMVVVAIASMQEHPKVPLVEQRLSAGAAVMNLMLSLRAQGFGSIWRTGDMTYDEVVKKGLGLGPNEEIVAFLYVGTSTGKERAVPELEVKEFVQSWQGPSHS